MFDHKTTHYLLRSAYEEAVLSPDPSNQNGALVVDDYGTILAASYNHVPPAAIVDFNNRDEKLKYICHAEEAATIVAAKLGIATRDKILICPWFACLPCARKILLAGYKAVIGHQRRMETTPERWKSEVDKALEWLLRAGVELRFHGDPIPDAPAIKVNGELWQP
jgi:deoxycytidylate deaminase